MSLSHMSQNYHFRKCHLERDQAPTQSAMKKFMSPALAAVCFKSMTPKLKVIAGLEPPMKGGGESWYIPPKDLLEGRIVMKPFKSKYMSQLTCYGVDEIGMKLVEIHRQQMKMKRKDIIGSNDEDWKRSVDTACRRHWDDCSAAALKANTYHIQTAFHQFSALYTVQITKFQEILFDAAIAKIRNVQEETFQQLQTKYEHLLRQQSTALYDEYSKMLKKEKRKLKTEFVHSLEKARTALGDKLHDINLDKHIAIEKLRNFLECQNLACRLYVALKEQDEFLKEMQLSKYAHSKVIKALTKEIVFKDVEIHLAEEKEKKQHEFDMIWKKKICHVVKNFQMFVSYCLNMLPEHAEFFINLEKLMLLQLDESLINSGTESIIKMDWKQYPAPVPKAHPFFLFCDQKYKTDVDLSLCPKHYTSSASQLPVIVVNKRCIYAACDNFEQFSDTIKRYLQGTQEDDPVFEDHHDYSVDVPVRYSSSQELKELKLESSLLQVLQAEIASLQDAQYRCLGCNIPYCFGCSSSSSSSSPSKKSVPLTKETSKKPSLASISLASSDKISTRVAELLYEREPKWESYMKYVKPRKCECAKIAKKHLLENLPAYMRNMSVYDQPELPNYETCSIKALKTLVRNARGKKEPLPLPPEVPPRTKDMSTQYVDIEFEELCTCLSDEGLEKFLKNLLNGNKAEPSCSTVQNFRVVGSSLSSSLLAKESTSFVTDRAMSLRHLIDQSSDVKEIFMKKDCKFD